MLIRLATDLNEQIWMEGLGKAIGKMSFIIDDLER